MPKAPVCVLAGLGETPYAYNPRHTHYQQALGLENPYLYITPLTLRTIGAKPKGTKGKGNKAQPKAHAAAKAALKGVRPPFFP